MEGEGRGVKIEGREGEDKRHRRGNISEWRRENRTNKIRGIGNENGDEGKRGKEAGKAREVVMGGEEEEGRTRPRCVCIRMDGGGGWRCVVEA